MSDLTDTLAKVQRWQYLNLATAVGVAILLIKSFI